MDSRARRRMKYKSHRKTFATHGKVEACNQKHGFHGYRIIKMQLHIDSRPSFSLDITVGLHHMMGVISRVFAHFIDF